MRTLTGEHEARREMDCEPCRQRWCATPDCERWFQSSDPRERYCFDCRVKLREAGLR